MRTALIAVFLSGCLLDQGRYIERQKEICHPDFGCADLPWWPDADADGWGDPTAEPEMSASQPEGFVNNRLDCNDSLAEITADIGGLCPAAFHTDPVLIAGGRVDADLGTGTLVEAEWVVVTGRDFLLHEAEDLCELGWGGVLGGPADILSVTDRVWATGTVAPLHSTWAQVSGESPEGAAFWSGDLASPGPEDSGDVACLRALPDPADWPTYEVPR